MPISIQDFATHSTGRRFTDVLNDPRTPFQSVLDFFSRGDTRRRMKESELHHESPAFAGVVKEFERIPEIDHFLRTNDAHTTQRFRQVLRCTPTGSSSATVVARYVSVM